MSINYRSEASWATMPKDGHPGHVYILSVPSKFEDGAAPASLASEAGVKEVDAFYVHPTTNLVTGDGDEHNSTLETEQSCPRIIKCLQHDASCFAGSTRVYAPYYRQATLRNYMAEGAAEIGAFQTAYEDVRAAFEVYLELHNRNPDGSRRPFILAGHSQGAQHVAKLLKEKFCGPQVEAQGGDAAVAAELRSLLVCAYIVGYPVGPSYFAPEGGHSSTTAAPGPTEDTIRAATSATDHTGVYLAWCTVGPGMTSTLAGGKLVSHQLVPQELGVAHSPVTWALADGVAAGKEAHRGAYDVEGGRLLKGLVTAKAAVTGCLLTVAEEETAELQTGVFASFPGDYHRGDYSLFWADIRENMKARVRAYTEKAAHKPIPTKLVAVSKDITSWWTVAAIMAGVVAVVAVVYAKAK